MNTKISPNFVNNFKDVIYLFDLEVRKPITFKSKADNAYEVHLALDHAYDYGDWSVITGYKIHVILTGPDLFEKDEFSGSHMDNKYVFDFLKWFHENPVLLHKTLYHNFFKQAIKEKSESNS
jgi:hypothetical protein